MANVLLLCVALFVTGIESFPSNTYPADTNVQCISNGGLCDISYGFGDPPFMMSSSGQMCSCPGNVTCPVSQDDPARVVNLKLKSVHGMTMRLSYCEKKLELARTCKFGEVAVTMEGESPSSFSLKVVGNIKCACANTLVLHTARPDGAYTLQEYTCGKVTCEINRSTPQVCERRHRRGFGHRHRVSEEILCQCPDRFTCSGRNRGRPAFALFGKQEEMTCEIGNSPW